MATSPTSLSPLSAEELKSVSTTLDRIRASYMDEASEGELTPHELVIRRQLEATWTLLLNFHTPDQAVPVLMHQLDVSRATAYRRCREATKLFGDVGQVSKEGLRHILYEHQMTVLKLALSAKASDGRNKPDLKAANQAIKQMAMLKGLSQIEAGVVDPSMLKGGTFLMQINIAGGKTRTIDLDRVTKMPAEEYRKVQEAVEGTGINADEMFEMIDDAARGWEESKELTEDIDHEEADGEDPNG